MPAMTSMGHGSPPCVETDTAETQRTGSCDAGVSVRQVANIGPPRLPPSRATREVLLARSIGVRSFRLRRTNRRTLHRAADARRARDEGRRAQRLRWRGFQRVALDSTQGAPEWCRFAW